MFESGIAWPVLSALVLGAGLGYLGARRPHALPSPNPATIDQVFTDIPVLFWMADLNGEMTYMNQRWLDATGVELKDLLGQGWRNLIHCEDRPHVEELWDAATRDFVPSEALCRLVMANGAPPRWHLARATLMRDKEGRPLYWLGTATDVHDQKSMESRLEREKLRFKTITDAIPGLVWVSLPDGNATFVSEGWTHFTGMTTSESLGMGWLAAMHPDDVPNEEWLFARDNGLPYEREVRMRGKNGRYERFLSRARPVLDPEGAVVEWIGASVNIEGQKQREDELAATEAELQNAVRSRDEFLATLSHELRTPMNVILGWLQILRTEAMPREEIDEIYETLERNATMQCQLIADLLDSSRIITGKFELDAAPLELASVARAGATSVQLAAAQKAIALELELASEVPAVMGDEARVTQVVWNLLSNAVKFTPQGGRVTVRTRTEDNHAILEVEDSGIGIEPGFLPHVFDRFRQEDSTMARRAGGLGLGLSIVKHIVELHGGTIGVDSSGKNMGARFTVRLPIT